MEAAIDALARWIAGPADLDESTGSNVGRYPFDPRRRCVSVCTADRALVKGAADAVLAKCGANTDGAALAMESMSSHGLRALAVATRVHACAVPRTAGEAEAGLTLLGLLGFQDPPRREAHAAIAACRRAGIKVVMITGDHPLTARSIAELVGVPPSETPTCSSGPTCRPTSRSSAQ